MMDGRTIGKASSAIENIEKMNRLKQKRLIIKTEYPTEDNHSRSK